MTRAPAALPLTLALALAGAACGFGRDVDGPGSYESVPTTRITDSAPYPLTSLLFIEHDLSMGQTRLYCFTGELGAADLGLSDLRRIAAQHGGFAMAFERPREHIELSDFESAGEPLQAQLGDQAIELLRLDNDGLAPSGASRYLGYLSTTDYHVAAFFAVLDAEDTLPAVSIESTGIQFEPEQKSPALELVQTDTLFGLSYTSGADYLVFELVQTIHDKSGDTDIDALVRTTLAPGMPYGMSKPLLTNVASQGCWSQERSLQARVHQLARRYQPQTGGDWAVVYERTDALEVEAAAWTAFADEPRPAAYCGDYE